MGEIQILYSRSSDECLDAKRGDSISGKVQRRKSLVSDISSEEILRREISEFVASNNYSIQGFIDFRDGVFEDFCISQPQILAFVFFFVTMTSLITTRLKTKTVIKIE